jgi:hypothetical protein
MPVFSGEPVLGHLYMYEIVMAATSHRIILSQSARSLTTNILSCITENLEALEIEKIILNPLR